jgi:Ca2+/Na+ antiporter
MLNRSQIFNYVTLALAIATICFSIWSMVTKFNPIVSVILMCVMLIFSHISKKLNQKENESIHTVDQESVVSNIKIKSEEK